MKQLTHRQSQLLAFIAQYESEHGMRPSFRIMGHRLGCSGVNCFKMYKIIEREGYLNAQS